MVAVSLFNIVIEKIGLYVGIVMIVVGLVVCITAILYVTVITNIFMLCQSSN